MSTDEPATTPLTQYQPSRRAAGEEGGDPACWLAQVCPECGRIAERHDLVRCAGCGGVLFAEQS